MKEFIIITLLLACSTSLALGQVFSGHVYNKDQKPATECNILAIDPESGEVLQFTTPNQQGYYELKLSEVKTSSIYLRCQGLIYQTQTLEIVLNAQKNTYSQNFYLENSQFNLNEVVIISQKPKIVINNDTVSFDATKFAQEQDVKVIDLLKRLPGIEVNDKSGQVSYKGKAIETLLIDGDDLFGSGYSVGVRNIPIKIIDKVEAIEDYHSNHLSKGLQRSDKVVLNLKLKKNTPALTGELGAGVGPGHYIGKADLILLNGAHKGFGVGLANNTSINETPFNEATYRAENNEELAHYSFDPLESSTVPNAPGFERSYNNRLVFGQYNHLLKLGKNTSLRANLALFEDRDQFSISSENRFSINGVANFSQSNAQRGQLKPKHKFLSLAFKTQLSDSANLTYDARLVDRSLYAQQNNLQNERAAFSSTLDQHKHFLQHKIAFAKRLSSSSLFTLQAYQAADRSTGNFEVRQGVSFLQPLELFSDARSNNQRNSLKLSASWLQKIKKGDVQLLLSQEAQKEKFHFIQVQTPYLFNYRKNWSQAKSIINFTGLNTLKFRGQLDGNYLEQNLAHPYENSSSSQHDLYWNAGLLLEWKLSKNSKLSFSSAKQATPLAPQYLHRARILLDSRTAQSNQPSLDLQHSWSNSLQFTHHNFFTQNSQNISLNYQESRNTLFSSQEIDSLFTIFTFYQLPLTRRSLTFAASQSILINPLSNLLSVGFNSKMDWYYNQLNNGPIAEIFSRQSSCSVALSSAFKGLFNYRVNTNLIFNQAKQGELPAYKMRMVIAEVVTHFKISKNTSLRWTVNAILPEEIENLNNQLFFDCMVQHRIPKRKMELFLMARNIFNRSEFLQIKTTEFSRSVIATSLFEPFAVLGISLSL